MLAGMAAGLITLSATAPLWFTEDEADRTTRFEKIDPQDFTTPEQAEHEDCIANDDWPRDEIPESALIRATDFGNLERVSFDVAFQHAQDGTAWFVASCTGPVAE